MARLPRNIVCDIYISNLRAEFRIEKTFFWLDSLDKVIVGFGRAKSHMEAIITYIVAGLPYSIFQIQYIF